MDNLAGQPADTRPQLPGVTIPSVTMPADDVIGSVDD